MIIEALELAGAYRVKLVPQVDERGFFLRRFCASIFADHGLETNFVQRSFSRNRKRGTLRGLHFSVQPHAETKLIRCTRGAVFDVIVDLRKVSPTFGQWHAEELTADNFTMLYVPCGFAHGFQTRIDDTEVDYEITPAYTPSSMRGLRYDDPQLGIPWPITNPILSATDSAWPSLAALKSAVDAISL